MKKLLLIGGGLALVALVAAFASCPTCPLRKREKPVEGALLEDGAEFCFKRLL